MPKAVCISGQIGTGKSTIAAHLSLSYGWDVISFGDYVRHVSQAKGLAQTREVYQRLGEELLTQTGPLQFLQAVIQYQQPESIVHLFDSVRHVTVLGAMKRIYSDVHVTYLILSDQQRYLRYLNRAATSDQLTTFEDFIRLGQQSTEAGIPDIAEVADLLVDASQPVPGLLTQIERNLRLHGIMEG